MARTEAVVCDSAAASDMAGIVTGTGTHSTKGTLNDMWLQASQRPNQVGTTLHVVNQDVDQFQNCKTPGRHVGRVPSHLRLPFAGSG